MAAIFGFSSQNQENSNKERLMAMSQSIRKNSSGAEPSIQVSAQGAIGSTQSENHLFHDGELMVAVSGSPHWSNSALSKVSGSRGLGAAVATAFQNHGPAMLNKLHGPFALAIVIPAERRVFLAAARLGIPPLAWTKYQSEVIFSSNAAAVQAFPDIQPRIDQQALFNYFYFHMVPSPGTIYAGTEKLLPGQYVDISGERIERKFYWSPPYEESSESATELSAELKERLRHAVKTAVTDNVATGAFLSGGLDSSTVAGYFSQIAEGQADAYGIGFDAEGYDEMEFARAAAKHFGIKLHEYYVTPEDVAEIVPRVAAAYDEPFGNASAIPAYFCARLARQDGKTTLLGGDGGDEIFAGNARYAKQQVFDYYSRIPSAIRSALIEPVATHFPLRDHIMPLRKLHSYIQQAKMPMPERMESYNFLHRTDPAKIFDKDFLGSINIHYPIDNQREAYERANTPEMLKKMLHLDLKITLADNDLRKVSRMCELAGIDVRYPMLDDELVEFSAGVPCKLLLKGNRLRDFYKRSLKDFLPPETLAKRKHGFGLPFGIWMAHDKRLKELADDSLVGIRDRGFIQAAYIDRLLEAHRSEHADYYGVMIWVMMMLEQWLVAHEHY